LTMLLRSMPSLVILDVGDLYFDAAIFVWLQ
jgi:hypothetical protein